MTDKNHTALLLVVDRSGSMASIRDEMVGSLTALLRDQAALPGLLTVDVVVFDDRIDTVALGADPRALVVELVPRGMTALLDAVGLAVTDLGARLAALPEHARPGRVLVVVATDGLENASHEWTPVTVRALLDQQRDTYSWEFLFLGANQDAVLTGTTLGFAADRSIDFDADGVSVQAVVAATSRVVGDVRQGRGGGFTAEDRRGSSSRRR